MTQLGFLCGFAAEARLLKDFPVVVHGDGGISGARRALERLPLSEVTALVSFGVAGGLDPDLRPGTLVIPDEILVGDRLLLTHPGFCAELRGQLPQALGGRMVSGDGLLTTAKAKSALFAASRARAVDLESGLLAEAAISAGLPFVIVRAIADPAGCGLPSAAQIPLSAGGRPNLPAILRDIAVSPGQIPRLLGLALETRRALSALRQTISALTRL